MASQPEPGVVTGGQPGDVRLPVPADAPESLADQVVSDQEAIGQTAELVQSLADSGTIPMAVAGDILDSLRGSGLEIDAAVAPSVGPGAVMIRAERVRQVAVEGYTAGHDAEHGNGELAEAAVAYTLAANGDGAYREFWPFRLADFKATDPLRCLVKAGALIAAELDRRIAEEGGRG